MAPPAKKQKPIASHSYFDLTEAMSGFPDLFRTLNTVLKDGLSEDKVHVLLPFLRFIASAVSNIPSSALPPSYPPSKSTLQQMTEKLGTDFNVFKREYIWTLTEDQLNQSAEKPLSGWAMTALEKIVDSPAFSTFQYKESIYTLFNILLTDRLDQLDDSAANKFCVSYNVPLTATVKQKYGGGTISGRADWSLGYIVDTTRLEQMLVVAVEARSAIQGDSIAQILAYLFAVQEAQMKAKKTAVFGILTDLVDFRFLVLHETGKAMQSEPLSWAMRSDQVVAFLDSILLDAIKLSAHTTPQKLANSTVKQFDDMTFDIPSEGSAVDDGDSDDDATFDVIKVDGVSVLISHQANRGDC
ncbi:predicted protein [Histoplasma capsulatum G186AR]|uniref:Uncharacterized protein n=2 Tax=Ajellomyces capsulatus TaxID=5037 RepID=C0NDC7_AJECG|nr:uncharacterized protein HCBG_01123 [Histoplasma capsulatum G186AR]EEH11668.1 predicted protein [Histoplasma capsulatum G186AR]KAG5302479.1 hypothetical protein I7I52_00144 [Histoplasma capsulatum]QSS72121.1 hypothetical protein I7I50_03187 [Histoplasma capsulatum G186AR]